ncbi:glycosyltransferase family 2 protein [Gammaproteobacteria bacterium]|nr:glycosyltransferase family 2 protein [Gammaproteobacteria bacterium]
MLLQKKLQLIENKDLFISCVVPVYNEQANIEKFLAELVSFLSNITEKYEIIVVDDGSKDETLSILTNSLLNKNIKLIGFSRNFGKEIAITAGLDNCSGDVAVIIDADFQHPLNLIPVFLKKWTDGYDMIYGVRSNREDESYLKRSFANLFYWSMSRMSKTIIPSNAGDFRLLDRKVINALKQVSERTRFMKGLYSWVGFKSCPVPYEVKKRAAGVSGWGFSSLAELAITGITSFSDIPLRMWSLFGFFISLISLVYAIYIVSVTMIFGSDLPGYPTLVVAIMFFGGIQLLSVGILGEYIARVFKEVKQRPNYIIDIKSGFDD